MKPCCIKIKFTVTNNFQRQPLKSLKEILEAGGNKFSMHNPGTWPKQAKLAAEGKWEDLELLKKHLKGGK